MKKYFKTIGKLVVLALVVLIIDVIMSYTLEVLYSLIKSGKGSYYVEMGVFRVLYAAVGFYVVIGGWAYLLASIIYYLGRTTDLFHNKFKYIIALAFLFYIPITPTSFWISPALTIYFIAVGVIYYGLVKREMLGIHIREVALWYVIFMLFFFFYWLSSMLQPKILIQQLIVYILLSFIAEKVYAKLFQNKLNSSS